MIRVLVMIAVAGFFVSIVTLSTAVAIGGPEAIADNAWSWGRGHWGWTDDLAVAIQFTKDDAANTPLPANARWRAITARKPPNHHE